MKCKNCIFLEDIIRVPMAGCKIKVVKPQTDCRYFKIKPKETIKASLDAVLFNKKLDL